MAVNMVNDIVSGHRARMLNLKKYYPFFKLTEISLSQFKDGKYEILDMGYIVMAVLRFFIEENNFKEKEVTYKEYQERSAFTQNRFRKKNAAAIVAYEEADKYITEHIKAYYIKGKPPELDDLKITSNRLKDKYNALVPEHNAFLKRQMAASQYTRQVRIYLQNKEQQERNRQYQERKHTQQRKKDVLE